MPSHTPFWLTRDDGVPFLFAGFDDAFDVEDAGIVDEDIEAAEFAGGGFDGGAPIGSAGDIEMNGNSGLVASFAINFFGECGSSPDRGRPR